MNETVVTLVGTVVAAPERRTSPQGGPVAAWRLASPTCRDDPGAGRVVEDHTNVVDVLAAGVLARHVVASVGAGDPVLVRGRLRVAGGRVEVRATEVGHDLRRGTTRFEPAAGRAPTAGGAPPARGARAPWPGDPETDAYEVVPL